MSEAKKGTPGAIEGLGPGGQEKPTVNYSAEDRIKQLVENSFHSINRLDDCIESAIDEHHNRNTHLVAGLFTEKSQLIQETFSILVYCKEKNILH